jgi:hypothetical protein
LAEASGGYRSSAEFISDLDFSWGFQLESE